MIDEDGKLVAGSERQFIAEMVDDLSVIGVEAEVYRGRRGEPYYDPERFWSVTWVARGVPFTITRTKLQDLKVAALMLATGQKLDDARDEIASLRANPSHELVRWSVHTGPLPWKARIAILLGNGICAGAFANKGRNTITVGVDAKVVVGGWRRWVPSWWMYWVNVPLSFFDTDGTGGQKGGDR